MADLQKLVHGELGWDAKYNALVDAVEKMGGVVNGLQWTKPTDEGIVLTNGFTGWVNYSYLQIGDNKLVWIEGALKGSLKSRQVTDVLMIPDNVSPQGKIYQERRWNVLSQIVGNKLQAYNDADGDDMNPSSWNVIFHFMYKI